jgi:hypothetical protein
MLGATCEPARSSAALARFTHGLKVGKAMLEDIVQVGDPVFDAAVEPLEPAVRLRHLMLQLQNPAAQCLRLSVRRALRELSISASRSGRSRRWIKWSITRPSSSPMPMEGPLQSVLPCWLGSSRCNSDKPFRHMMSRFAVSCCPRKSRKRRRHRAIGCPAPAAVCGRKEYPSSTLPVSQSTIKIRGPELARWWLI